MAAAKPKAGPAKAAAVAWVKASFKVDADKPDFTALAATTGDNFRVFVIHEQPDGVCEATVTDRAKLNEALACVRKTNALSDRLKAWNKKDLKKLWGDMREHADEISALAKDNLLFTHYEEGEGIVVLSIVAVGTGADKKPHVTAVFAQELYN